MHFTCCFITFALCAWLVKLSQIPRYKYSQKKVATIMKSRPSSTIQNYKHTLPFYARWQESVKCERFFGRKCDYSVAILLLPVLSTLVYTPPLTHLMLFVLKKRSFHTVSLATAGSFSVCTQIIQSVFNKRIFGGNLLRDDFVIPTREQHRYFVEYLYFCICFVWYFG